MPLRLGLGLTGQRVGINPADLFAVSGSRGFMYDLSDYSSQFQDTAGTTPITATSQSVGLVLDKSQGLALGPELVTNGDFSSATGWFLNFTAPATASISGGVFSFSSPAGEAANAAQPILTIGKWYRVNIVVTAASGAGVRVQAGSGASGTGLFTMTAAGSYSFLLLNNGSDGQLFVVRAGAGSGTVDSISVKELAGNHATQATAGNRPLTTTIGSGYRGIQFDGVDDWLQTAAIDFSNSDEVTVVAGVRKLSDAARGMLVELGVASLGGIAFNAPNAAANPVYVFATTGTTTAQAVASGAAAPNTSVVSGQAKISTDTAIIRQNGAPVGTDATDQGTGNYANAIVYIGRRGGTTLPFNGVLTFLFVINRLLSASELAAVERFANSRTGAF